MRPIIFVTLVLKGFDPSPLLAQPYTGDIRGKVVDRATRQPLPGVNVRVADTVYGAATDALGNYRIAKVPVGTYRLRFSMVGFREAVKTDVVVKSSKSTLGVDVELEESLIAEKEVTVSASIMKKSAGRLAPPKMSAAPFACCPAWRWPAIVATT